MSTRDTIRELLDRDPFQSFRILTSGGESYIVRDRHTVALLKSDIFVAHPGSDRWTFVPFLHVAAVDAVRNGARRMGRK